MKTSKEIYSNLNLGNNVETEQLQKIKNIELQMLKDVDYVCNVNNIPYIMAYGTMLGAIRHQGFIPWDDDIDICMKREDISRFCLAFKHLYKDKYNIVESKRRPIYFYMIEKKGTRVYELGCDNINLITGVKIDIFPLDYAGTDKEKIITKLQVLLIRAASLRQDFCYPSPKLMEINNRQVRNYYMIRRAAGMVFFIFPRKFYLRLYKKICISTKKSDVVCCGINRKHYKLNIIESRKRYKFEDGEFWGPKDGDYYLQNTYGKDYMILPPMNKRENHSYIRVDL